MRSTPEDLQRKLVAFGCNTWIIDGHKNESIDKVRVYSNAYPSLNAFILKTQKGKGIKFLEEHPSYHVFYFHENPKILKQTLEDLK